MLKGIKDRMRRTAVSLGSYAAVSTALVLFAVGVLYLPLTFGEALAVLGIWLTLGVVLGQSRMGTTNKEDRDAQSRKLMRLLLVFYIVFASIGLIYMEHRHESRGVAIAEVLGLLVLTSVGLLAGYVAGYDEKPSE